MKKKCPISSNVNNLYLIKFYILLLFYNKTCILMNCIGNNGAKAGETIVYWYGTKVIHGQAVRKYHETWILSIKS